jgi:hypothetical protein
MFALACILEMKSVCSVVLKKPEGKRPLRRCGCRYKNIIPTVNIEVER